MIKYSSKVSSLLSVNKFTPKNISILIGSAISINRVNISSMSELIYAMELGISMNDGYNRDTGCIFSLSSGRRDGQCYVYHVSLSELELSRMIDLKSFL